MGLAGPAGASLKRKIPRSRSKEFANSVSEEIEQQYPVKIDAKLEASIFSRTVLKERFPPEA
jgi:hypothetical protein